MLQHVKVKYDDGSSLADFSSSLSPTGDQATNPAQQGLPTIRESSCVEPSRLRDNMALKRIDSRITTTRQSDVWSFDSQSSALPPPRPAITSNALSTSQGHSIAPPVPPRNHNRIADINGHLHHPSVDEVVEQSVFSSSPVPATNPPRVSYHPIQPSIMPQKLPSQSSSWKTVTTRIPPYDTNSMKSHQRFLKEGVINTLSDLPSNKGRLSLQSGPSRWSADFDKFEDYDLVKAQNAANDQFRKENQQTRIERGPDAEDLARSTESEVAVSEVTYPSASGFEYALNGNNENFVSGHHNADEQLYHDANGCGSIDSQDVFPDPAPAWDSRQLLSPGQAVFNAQLATGNLQVIVKQAEEAVEQLAFEDSRRSQFTDIAIGDRAAALQELCLAHEGTRERDREIWRLRSLLQDALEQPVPFSYYAPSEAGAIDAFTTRSTIHHGPIVEDAEEEDGTCATRSQRVSKAQTNFTTAVLSRQRALDNADN
jgi:hypothetical protein